MTISIVSSPDYFDFAELLSPHVDDQRTLLRLTNSVVDKCNEVTTREVDDALDDASHPFRSIIEQQEQELQALYREREQREDKRDVLHEVLVNVARTSEVIDGYCRASQKINAIKELRRLTNASLKASKDAIEDPRVWSPPAFEVVGVMFVGSDD